MDIYASRTAGLRKLEQQFVSWTLFQGVSDKDVRVAASWVTPHTFTRFYELDVTAPTLSHIVVVVPDMPV